jgi:hypothetical protein
MNQNKTFRLFISSTFSDFSREREVLQSKIFPYIKDYASKYGYSFQPIDLRWGVSNEAQLDQKTLDLCLSEVRTCKKHMHPNFLVMLGDRYGWIPLPFAIESSEFKKLLLSLNDQEQQELHKWYQEDKNQFPTSFILKERNVQFSAPAEWEVVENNLRHILQKAAQASKISDKQKSKYFLSATEAEVKEGVISYLQHTKFQQQLLSQSPLIEEIDIQNIFGFFRGINQSTVISDHFVSSDYDKAQNFKQQLCQVLIDSNTLKATTCQLSSNMLDESYLNEFQIRITKFLESQIDAQVNQDKKEKLTTLQVELLEQNYYAQYKLNNFIGGDVLQRNIFSYISGDNPQPLVVYGNSGCGKSAAMANAISVARNSLDQKVLFRFVGASANSNSTIDVLTSIFDELGVNIPSKQDTLMQFSQRVYSEILKIQTKVVIFIDAVDQLHNTDMFLWLPEQLPSNIKIIISALSDEKYAKDTKYFQSLKEKTSNLHKVPVFDEPSILLKKLLFQGCRTLQPEQELYFLKCYSSSPSPLYINIAAQEIKNWKSSDSTEEDSQYIDMIKQHLKPTLQGVIQDFIKNLSEVHHHNKKFVDRVLGYILASKDGLSESELLQLISVDSNFIESVAPETWHQNITKELPLIHWSRLQAQLKPFLRNINQDNEVLLNFFHREFVDGIEKIDSRQSEHESIIKTTQILIIKNKDKPFNHNRWGKLYFQLVTDFELKYNCNAKFEEYSRFIATEFDEDSHLIAKWTEDLLIFAEACTNEALRSNEFDRGLIYSKFSHYITNELKDISGMIITHLSSLGSISTSYSELGNYDTSHKYTKILLELFEQLLNTEISGVFRKLILGGYCEALNNFIISMKKQNVTEKKQAISNEIEVNENKVIALLKNLDFKDEFDLLLRPYVLTLINKALSLYDSGKPLLAIDKTNEALELLNTKNGAENYWKQENRINAYINLIIFYESIDRVKATYFGEKACLEAETVYKNNREIGFTKYIDALLNTAGVSHHDFKKQMSYLVEARKLIEEKFDISPVNWITQYVSILYNTAYLYRSTSLSSDEADCLVKIFSLSNEYNLIDTAQFKDTLRQLQYMQLSQDLNLTMPLVGINRKSTDLDFKAIKTKIMQEFTENFTSINLASFEDVKKISSSNPTFKVKLTEWLIDVANLTIILREHSEVNFAHELSYIFMKCKEIAGSDENIKAISNRVESVYHQTKSYPKTNFIPIRLG